MLERNRSVRMTSKKIYNTDFHDSFAIETSGGTWEGEKLGLYSLDHVETVKTTMGVEKKRNARAE